MVFVGKGIRKGDLRRVRERLFGFSYGMGTLVVSKEAAERLQRMEAMNGKSWLEKELTRLLRQWQGASRTSFAANRKPPWWVPTHEIIFNGNVVTVPPFQSKKKGGWTQDVVRSLIGAAYDTMIDWEEPESEAEKEKKTEQRKDTKSEDAKTKVVKTEEAEQRKDSKSEDSKMQVEETEEMYSLNASGTPVKELLTVSAVEEELTESPDRRSPMNHSLPRQTFTRQSDSADVDEIVAELELEVQARCEALRSFSEQTALSLQNAYRVEVLKLPKRVRSMSIRQFYDRYAGDVDAVLLQDIRKKVEESIAMEFRRHPGMLCTYLSKLPTNLAIVTLLIETLTILFSVHDFVYSKKGNAETSAGNKRRWAKATNAASEALATGRVRRTRARTREALRDASNTLNTPGGFNEDEVRSPNTAKKLSKRPPVVDEASLQTPAVEHRSRDFFDEAPMSAIRSIRRGKGSNRVTRIELDDGQEIEVSRNMESKAKYIAKQKLLALQDELQQLMGELSD